MSDDKPLDYKESFVVDESRPLPVAFLHTSTSAVVMGLAMAGQKTMIIIASIGASIDGSSNISDAVPGSKEHKLLITLLEKQLAKMKGEVQ